MSLADALRDTKPDAPPAARPKKKGGLMAALDTESDAKPAQTQKQEPQSDSWITRSVLKTVTGKGFSERLTGDDFSKVIKQFIPGEDNPSDFTRRFTTELYKAGPEILDFATSPAGLSLMAAHAFPLTQPVAAAADVFMAAQQGMGAIGSFEEFYKDRSPESLARGVVSLAGMYGMGKAGVKTLAGTRIGRAAPPSIRPGEAVRAEIEKLPQSERPQTLSELGKPKTLKEKAKAAVYRREGIRDIASSLMSIPKTKIGQVASEIVDDRAAFMGKRSFEVNTLLHDIAKDVDPSERTIQKMGYVMQGSATPEEVGLSPKATAAIEKLKDFNTRQTELLKEAYGKDMPLQDAQHYLTQVWKFDENDKTGLRRAANQLMRDPFLKRRTIESYKHGIEVEGMTPRYDDVLQLVKLRADFATKAIANRRFADSLVKMGAMLNEDEFHHLSRSPEGRAALGDWRQAVEAHALDKAAYVGKVKDKFGAMRPVTQRRPVYLHPDVEQAVNAIFAKPWDNWPVHAAETIRSFGKKWALSFSLFHHGALSEQTHALMMAPGRDMSLTEKVGKSLKGTYVVNPEIYKGLASGMYEVMGKKSPYDPPAMRIKQRGIASDAIEHGLNLTSEDIESKAAKEMKEFGMDRGRVLKAATAPVRVAGKVMHVLDRSLWDYFHQNSMLTSYETVVNSELANYKRKGIDLDAGQIKNVKRSVAEHINNAYGSINFEKLMVHPKMRQVLNFMLLAPAWTFSNARVFTRGFESAFDARLSSQYAAGAMISWFITANLANYALSGYYNTKDKNGKPGAHFIWDNAGAPLMIAGKRVGDLTEGVGTISAGYNANGTERKINLGKGLKEPPIMALSPIPGIPGPSPTEFWGGKASLPLRTAAVLWTGAEPGTGFQVIDPKATSAEKAMQRISAATTLFAPFVFRDAQRNIEHALMPGMFPKPATNTQFFSLPTSAGLSLTHATQLYTDAMDRGDTAMVQAVVKAAQLNHIKVRSIQAGYRDRLRKRKRNIQGPSETYDEFGNRVAAGR